LFCRIPYHLHHTTWIFFTFFFFFFTRYRYAVAALTVPLLLPALLPPFAFFIYGYWTLRTRYAWFARCWLLVRLVLDAVLVRIYLPIIYWLRYFTVVDVIAVATHARYLHVLWFAAFRCRLVRVLVTRRSRTFYLRIQFQFAILRRLRFACIRLRAHVPRYYRCWLPRFPGFLPHTLRLFCFARSHYLQFSTRTCAPRLVPFATHTFFAARHRRYWTVTALRSVCFPRTGYCVLPLTDPFAARARSFCMPFARGPRILPRVCRTHCRHFTRHTNTIFCRALLLRLHLLYAVRITTGTLRLTVLTALFSLPVRAGLRFTSWLPLIRVHCAYPARFG